MLRLTLLAAALAVTTAGSAAAEDAPTVTDAYAIASGPAAKAGAAFLTIANPGPGDDRLVAVRTEVAARAELHRHVVDQAGVARMEPAADGFEIPAGGTRVLARGGDHIMFMGLAAPFTQGRLLPVTLVFEKAGEIEVEIPVDLERREETGAGHGGAGTGHGSGSGG